MKSPAAFKIIVVVVLSLTFGKCTAAQTDEEQIIQTMEKWNEAVISKDIDAIVEFYSDNFTSLEAEGKEGVKFMW